MYSVCVPRGYHVTSEFSGDTTQYYTGLRKSLMWHMITLPVMVSSLLVE